MAQEKNPNPTPANSELTATGVEDFAVLQASSEAQDAQFAAVEDILEHLEPQPANNEATLKAISSILEGASPDDAAALKAALLRWQKFEAKMPISPDDELVDDWRSAVYPYKNRLSRKSYEKQKYHLQVELLKLQAWVRETGQRVVILFEGRDAAGKGGRLSVSWNTSTRVVRVLWRWKSRPKWNVGNGIFSVTSSTCRLPVKSC